MHILTIQELSWYSEVCTDTTYLSNGTNTIHYKQKRVLYANLVVQIVYNVIPPSKEALLYVSTTYAYPIAYTEPLNQLNLCRGDVAVGAMAYVLQHVYIWNGMKTKNSITNSSSVYCI